VRFFTWRDEVVGSSEVTGCEVADGESGSAAGETPPPGVLTQGCEFMGVIFRGNVRM
jgi:hypothetical protein